MIPIKFSTILQLLIVLAAILMAALYYGRSDEIALYWTPTGLALAECICVILFLANGKMARKCPLIILLSSTLLLFVVTRLVFLSLSPEDFLGYARITPELFNRTLLFVLLGTIACFAGIIFGYMFCRPSNVTEKRLRHYVNPEYLAFAVLGSVIIKLLVYGFFGYGGSSGSGESLGFFQRYVVRLVNPFNFMVMFLASYYLEDKTRRRLKHLAITTVAFTGYLFMIGSRAGIFETGIILLATLIYFKGDAKIKIRPRLVVTVLAAACLAVVAFPIGTHLRQIQWIAGDTSVGAVWNVVSNPNTYAVDIQGLMYQISYRMNLIEPSFYVLNAREVGLGDVSDLVNAKVTAISSVNRLIPGKPFGDILFSEYAFGYIYRPGGVVSNQQLGQIDRVGYTWGMYGIAYQLFGFAGGLGFIAVFSALLTFLLVYTQKRLTFFRACVGSFFIYTFYMWINNVGLDNLVDRTVHTLGLMIVYIMVWLTFSRRRPVEAQAVRWKNPAIETVPRMGNT